MRQIPSLDGPLKASRRLSGWCGGRQGASRRACEGLNLHRTVSDSPAVSFNLRVSEILPGLGEDFDAQCGGDFRYTLNSWPPEPAGSWT
jgi:hypothetical protein